MMLTTMIAAVVLVGLLFAGMAVGVIFANKPVKGSCGGLGAAGVDGKCGLCGRDAGESCDSDEEGGSSEQAGRLARNAMKV